MCMCLLSMHRIGPPHRYLANEIQMLQLETFSDKLKVLHWMAHSVISGLFFLCNSCQTHQTRTHLTFPSPDVHSSASFHSAQHGTTSCAEQPSNAATVNRGSSSSGSLRRSLSNSGLGRARQRVTSLTSTLRNSIIMTEKDDAQSVKTATSTVAPSVTPSKKRFRHSFCARFSRGSRAGEIEPLQDEKPLVTPCIQILG